MRNVITYLFLVHAVLMQKKNASAKLFYAQSEMS